MDGERLTQVVANLLSNAVRYSPTGSRVVTSVKERDGSAIIKVSDNGVGLSTLQHASIFELFVQADNSLARDKSGLGLVLSLARTLLEMHSGSISVDSPGLGKGSTFTVLLAG